MRILNASLLLMAAFAARMPAQVLPPAEIKDPALRALQQAHLDELHTVASGVASHKFPYHFYLSRSLDLSEAQQPRADQRAIQFDRFQGQIVLKVTGNYFAAYSAKTMTGEQRAVRTYRDVMLPILQEAVPMLAKSEAPDAFALEISHHVLRKVLGTDTEFAENVVLILPKASAARLVAAKDDAERDSALLEGTAYLNAEPTSLVAGGAPRAAAPAPEISSTPAASAAANRAATTGSGTKPQSALEGKYRETIARMSKDLDSQAHFVAYEQPSFIAFRGASYLQIPVRTTLASADAGSQYKLAALAFDRHIAHLIRPVLGYFKDASDFAGIDFSTSIRLEGSDSGLESVEFIFPISALRTYGEFGLTGQQLLDAGVVLVNGERAGVDLQNAEAQAGPRN